jgi:hypothetical protein
MKVFTPLLLTAALLFAGPVLAEEGASSTADTNNEILMQKIKADKKLLVASNMDLTDAEAKQFWPLYDAYQKELNKINQRLVDTVKEYAKEYKKGPLANDTAKKLLNEALGVQESELKLKRTYADKIGKVLPAYKTVRYIQIENKIRAVLNAVLAQEIPLVY